MIFRLQNNVPEVYVDKSMDFQLFTRIFDLAFNSTKHSINTTSRIASTMECDESTLPLLAYKLGFFENTNLTHKQLRLLLSAFPSIIHNKGTYKAVEQVVHLFSRLNDSTGTVQGPMDYTFQLVFYPAINNTDLLIVLLKYILPTGYDIQYIAANTSEEFTVVGITSDITAGLFDMNYYPRFNGIVPGDDTDVDEINNKVLNNDIKYTNGVDTNDNPIYVEDMGDLRKTAFFNSAKEESTSWVQTQQN